MAHRRQMLGLMTALYIISIVLFCQSLLSRGELPPPDTTAASAGTTSTTSSSTAASSMTSAETDVSASATTVVTSVPSSSSSSGSTASGSTPAGSTRMVPDKEADEIEIVPKKAPKSVNFASISAGAVVLEASDKSSGYNNLLNEDKDKYGISPCSEKKWVVIGLSEDIMVRSVVVANYEKYSSYLQDFQVLGSATYPVSEWLDLGSYSAEPKLGEQEFELSNPAHARYLKFRFLTHFGDEFYCTLSQIRVHGLTMYENFKQEVERSDEEVRNMHSALLTDDGILPETQGMGLNTGREIGSAEENVSADVIDNSPGESSNAENHSESGRGDILDSISQGNSEKNEATNVSFVADAGVAEVNHSPESEVRTGNEDVTAHAITLDSRRAAEPSDDVSTNSNAGIDVQQNQELDVKGNGISSSSDDPTVAGATNSPRDNKEGIPTDGIASIYESDESDEAEHIDKPHHDNDTPLVVESGTARLDSIHGVAEASDNSESAKNIDAPFEVNSTDVRSQPISALAMVCRLAANIVGEIESICQPETVSNIFNTSIDDSYNKSILVKSLLDHNDTTDGIHTTAVVDTFDSTAGGKSPDTIACNQHELNSSNMLSDPQLSRSDSVVEVTDMKDRDSSQVEEKGNTAIAIDFLVNQSSQHEGHKVASNEGKVVTNETKLSNIHSEQRLFASESQRASSNNSETNSDAGEENFDPKVNINGTGDVETNVQKSNDGENENITVFVSEGLENNSLATALISDMEKISLSISAQLLNQSLPTGSEKPILSSKARECYEGLKLADFQAKMRAKLQVSAETNLGPQDNVFRALMQRIKSLEMNNGIVEMYIAQISDCYRSVLNDLIAAGNTSAVALALMVNTREGNGLPKQFTEDVGVKEKNNSNLSETLTVVENNLSKISKEVQHDYKYLYIFIAVIVMFLFVIVIYGAKLIFSLQRKIEELEKHLQN